MPFIVSGRKVPWISGQRDHAIIHGEQRVVLRVVTWQTIKQRKTVTGVYVNLYSTGAISQFHT